MRSQSVEKDNEENNDPILDAMVLIFHILKESNEVYKFCLGTGVTQIFIEVRLRDR